MEHLFSVSCTTIYSFDLVFLSKMIILDLKSNFTTDDFRVKIYTGRGKYEL